MLAHLTSRSTLSYVGSQNVAVRRSDLKLKIANPRSTKATHPRLANINIVLNILSTFLFQELSAFGFILQPRNSFSLYPRNR